MRGSSWILAALLASSPPTTALVSQDEAAPGEETEPEARLTRVEGTVYVHLYGKPDGEFIAAEPDAGLEAGDMVRTGRDGTAEVALDGESVIEVRPDSDFILNSLEPGQTEFHLGIGAVVAKIRSLLPGRRMEFHTSEAVASVRGTELAVSQEADGKPTRVGVFGEGHVSVRSGEDPGVTALSPGQECDARRGGPPSAARDLRDLAPMQERVGVIGRRQESMRGHWAPRSPAARRAQRRGFERRRAISAEKLRNIRADRRGRVYEQLRRRQAEFRQRAEERRGRRRQEFQRRRDDSGQPGQEQRRQERRERRRDRREERAGPRRQQSEEPDGRQTQPNGPRQDQGGQNRRRRPQRGGPRDRR